MQPNQKLCKECGVYLLINRKSKMCYECDYIYKGYKLMADWIVAKATDKNRKKYQR